MGGKKMNNLEDRNRETEGGSKEKKQNKCILLFQDNFDQIISNYLLIL